MKTLTPNLRARIIDALNHIPADCDFETWSKVGMSLAAFGEDGFRLFDQWSSTSAKYPGQAKIVKAFSRFDPAGKVQIGTLFHFCKLAGHIAQPVGVEITGAKETASAASFNPASGGGGNPDAKREQNIRRAKSLWNNGWACSSEDEVYAGALLEKADNAWQKAHIRGQMHTIRDAAFAYFAARYLDPRWMPQLRLCGLDTGHGDDRAMKERDAVGFIAMPMATNGVIRGLQRVYIDKSGQKIDRLMIGALGTMNLAPFSERPLIALPETQNGLILWGEGFETCALSVQSSGLPALVLYTAGQIISRSAMYREQAATATADQIAAMPTIGLLVDRDASLTGQKSCTKAIQNFRAAGMSGLYLEPPRSVWGSEKGADWADAVREIGQDATGLAMAVAMAKQPEIPEERADRAAPVAVSDNLGDMGDIGDYDYLEPISLEDMDIAEFGRAGRKYNYRAVSPDAPALEDVKPQSATVARAIMKTGMERLVDSYVDWLDAYRDAEARAEEIGGHILIPEFAPFLFQPTTGAGKSTELKKLPDNPAIQSVGGAVRIFVSTHDECESYCTANPAFFMYHGRSPDPTSPGFCANHVEMMKAVDSGHIPQAEFCFTCKYGLKWSIEYHGKDSKQGIAAREKLHTMGLSDEDIEAIDTCVWQSHLRTTIKQQHVVMTYHSFSENIATWIHEEDCKIVKTPALCCFDEHVPLAAPLEKVTQERISEWAKRNDSNVRHLEYAIANPGKEDNLDILRDSVKTAHTVHGLLINFAHALAEMTGKTGRILPDSPVWGAVDALIGAAGKDSKALATWEKIAFDKTGMLSEVPLRAAFGIAQTLKVNDGLIEGGAMYVSAIKPILERIGKMPTAIFDATPSPVTTSIVKAKNGVIVEAIAEQFVEIDRYTDRFYGLTPLKMYGSKRQDQELSRYEGMMKHFRGRKFIFHKAATDYLDPENINDDLAHWGGGHRAHNRFELEHLCLAGSFFVPPSRVRQIYQADRLAAITGGADPEDWPLMQDYTPKIGEDGKEHDDAFEEMVWVREDDREVKCFVPLPRQQKICEWFLIKATIESVQGIGRGRGANAAPEKPLKIAIFGGVPLFGLHRYGLCVHAYLDDPEALGWSKASRNADAHESVMDDLEDAAIYAAAAGEGVGRESVADHVLDIRTKAIESRILKENQQGTEAVEDGEGVCHPMVIDTIYRGVTNPPATAQAQKMKPESYQQWLESHGLRIFAKHMKANGRAAAAVKTAQQAIDTQPAQDVETMFMRLEAFAKTYEREVEDGDCSTFAEAVEYDMSVFQGEISGQTAQVIAEIMDGQPDADTDTDAVAMEVMS